nr:40S ribosomal protein S18 [Tanacetum cinerariifolium]
MSCLLVVEDTITVPSESLLNELRIVKDMKRQCDHKRASYEEIKIKHKLHKRRLESNKGKYVSSNQLKAAEEELEAAMEREVELEHRALDASTSFAMIQIKGELDTLDRTKDEEAKKFKSQKIHFDLSILIRIKVMVDVSSKCMEVALNAEIDNLMTIVANPGQFKITNRFLNRKKDYKDDKYSQVTSNSLDMKLRDDTERLKKIRSVMFPPFILTFSTGSLIPDGSLCVTNCGIVNIRGRYFIDQ